MESYKGQNAVKALLGEYKKAILELQTIIEDLEICELAKIIDSETDNPDCKSIQTIISHIISSGYSYCVYIRNLKDPSIKRPEKTLKSSALEYKVALSEVLEYTEETFAHILDNELEEYDNAKKMKTSWGQFYDIEQLMEHAIVHILRHRRQIQKFKTLVR